MKVSQADAIDAFVVVVEVAAAVTASARNVALQQQQQSVCSKTVQDSQEVYVSRVRYLCDLTLARLNLRIRCSILGENNLK